jgi:EmrB/QacA subfamily drug resistance transporter
MAAVAAIRTPRSLAIGKAGLYLATFMAVFDIAVVYLALPSIERSIGAGLADQVWIASAYALMEAGFTLAAGTLGDLYGRKRVYIIGVSIFIIASIASGLAPNPGLLIAARFVQGVGGAIAMALPLAILCSMVDGDDATAGAIRTYATIAGMGAVTAPVLGGILVHFLGWRSVFFVNVPLSVFVLYAAIWHTSESPADPGKRLDLLGQVTSILALLAFSFAAIEGNALGWRSTAIVATALLSVVSAVAFVAIERRVPTPMIRFSLLREPLLAVGAWNMLLMNVGFFTLYLIASLFLQDVRGLDPLNAGWYLLANNLLFFLTNQFGGPISARLGRHAAVLLGMGFGVVGLASFAFFRVDTPAAFAMIPLALCGFGWGLAYAPLNTLAMSVVPKNDDGLASGLLSIGRPLGAVFGTAIFGSLLAAAMQTALDQRLAALGVPETVSDQIEAAIHHGGLWSLLGKAADYGLPPGTLTGSIDAGFIAGMHVSGIAAALASVAAIAYTFHAYRSGAG